MGASVAASRSRIFRGVLLSSNGIVVSKFNQLLNHPLLEGWRVLQDGSEHYALIIDGDFELMTNRDAVAPTSRSCGDGVSRTRSGAFSSSSGGPRREMCCRPQLLIG